MLDDMYFSLCALADAIIEKCALAWFSLLLIKAADSKRAMLGLVVKMWQMSDSDRYQLTVELVDSLDEIRRERRARK